MRSQQKSLYLASLVLCFLVLAASVASAGHYYEMLSTTESPQSRRGTEQRYEGWVDGPSTKVVFHTGEKKGFFADGSYLVTKDAGENVFLVNPKEKTYARFDMEELMSTMGSVFNMMDQMGQAGGLMKMEFTDVSHEKVSEGPGEPILGHSTTHYQTKSAYTMRLAIMGMKQENRTEMVQDIWSTDEYDASGFAVWLRPDQRMRTGNEGLDQLMESSWGSLKGFPLKTVVVSTTTNKKGKTSTTTQTNEVIVMRAESVPASTFEVPADYTETQILPEMQGMPGTDPQAGKKEKKKKGGLSSVFDKPDDDG